MVAEFAGLPWCGDWVCGGALFLPWLEPGPPTHHPSIRLGHPAIPRVLLGSEYMTSSFPFSTCTHRRSPRFLVVSRALSAQSNLLCYSAPVPPARSDFCPPPDFRESGRSPKRPWTPSPRKVARTGAMCSRRPSLRMCRRRRRWPSCRQRAREDRRTDEFPRRARNHGTNLTTARSPGRQTRDRLLWSTRLSTVSLWYNLPHTIDRGRAGVGTREGRG